MLIKISIWCYFAIIELIVIIGLTLIWCNLHNKIFMHKIYHKEIKQHINTIMKNEKDMYDTLKSIRSDVNNANSQNLDHMELAIRQNHELLLNIEAKVDK